MGEKCERDIIMQEPEVLHLEVDHDGRMLTNFMGGK
jgi:hypothetical protein